MGSFTTFRVYRYQLLPIDRYTTDLYDQITPSELIERKNQLFAQTLPFVAQGRIFGTDLIVQIEATSNEAFILRLAPYRPLMRERPDFQIEQVDHWPHMTAIILNRPNEQYIAVQERIAAFASTDTVVRFIEKATRSALERVGLRLHIEVMFRETYFWELVEQYLGRITCVRFEFVTPNMANISSTLAGALKNVSKDTNAAKSNLQLESDPGSALNITAENPTVQGLVDYTSQGGGDITLKVKNIRKRFHTSSSSREIELSELELTTSPDKVADILREILK